MDIFIMQKKYEYNIFKRKVNYKIAKSWFLLVDRPIMKNTIKFSGKIYSKCKSKKYKYSKSILLPSINIWGFYR